MRIACEKLQDLASALGPSAKLPTILELRDQLGMSVQTVHFAIRELEKREILRSVRGVGVFVADSAPKRVLTGNIGFLNDPAQFDLSPAFWHPLFGGVRAGASLHGQDVLVVDNSVAFKNWDKVDGIVLTDMFSGKSAADSVQCPPPGFPCISIINPQPDMVTVRADDFAGAYALTKHLIELGHRRIAFLITYVPYLTILEDRRQGYLAALADHGIEFDPRWLKKMSHGHGNNDGDTWYQEGGEYYVDQWLKGDWHELGCTALLMLNDETAVGAIKAFQKAGLNVPHDVSVTGFDGTIETESQGLRLTTARVPLREIGREAGRLLYAWIDNPQRRPQSVTLPVDLIRGSTTGPAPNQSEQ